jgi:hypothetical protein
MGDRISNGNWYFIVGSLGLGMLALVAGTKGVKANQIVDVSFILKRKLFRRDLLKIGQKV